MMVHSDLRLVLLVKATTAGQTVRMISDGEGYAESCFDTPTWGKYDFAANGYTKGNGDFAFSTSICDDAIISVGAYITANKWTNYKNIEYRYNPSPLTGKKQVIGEIADFSSYGVDDNGKPHPTLIAPGQGVISVANNYDSLMFQDLPLPISPREIRCRQVMARLMP